MTTETQTADEQAMNGGLPPMDSPVPAHGSAFPGELQTPTETETPSPAPVDNQKYVVGSRVFATADEALAYANGMAESQAHAAGALNHPTETVQPTAQPKLGQLIFEDPEAALQQVKNQAKEEMRAEQRTIAENDRFWENFYSKHPDLKGSELLVDAVLAREQNTRNLSGMTRDEAAPILAAKARQEVSKIRNVPSGGQALPSKTAMVAGSSGAPVSQPTATKPAATNFISELKGMRKRG